jgi:two-component system response regulator BaeR
LNSLIVEKILIVEDEPKLAALVADYLRAEAFGVHLIDDGLQVVPWVRENKPDLILLDLMLPGRDGLEICRELRTFTDVPVVMVTARVEEIDRLVGLEAGADDYVCKPFSLRELVARVKAILRRAGGGGAAVGGGALAVGDVALDRASRVVTVAGEPVELTSREFDLLAALLAHPGVVLSRDRLLELAWEGEFAGGTRTVDVHVAQLRGKLGRPDFVATVRGAGYKVSP